MSLTNFEKNYNSMYTNDFVNFLLLSVFYKISQITKIKKKL